jgi:lysyl-tRNA synthetase class 2
MKNTEFNLRWRPGARIETLRARDALLKQVRQFFSERGLMEVETPVLSRHGNCDPGLLQWETGGQRTFLRTSPEYAMKRLLAAGCGDIYELGRVFRADESGRIHNREFTLLEWYRQDWTYHELMEEVSKLVQLCLDRGPLTVQRLTYREMFKHYAGLDPFKVGQEQLNACLSDTGLGTPGLGRQACLDLLLGMMIQPQLPEDTLTFVYDFPESQAALAQLRREDPAVAERFELFIGPVEIANGYQELTDADELRQRFEQENAHRAEAGQATVPCDVWLLEAMQHGLPACSGVALGLDRLLMLRCGETHIDAVLSFSSERA